jgi:hypothetical protein
MTLYQFNLADEMEQIEAFWDGTFVGEIQVDDYTIECRQINDFYVEYKKKNGHYVDMRSHRNPKLIEPYLNQLGRIDL